MVPGEDRPCPIVELQLGAFPEQVPHEHVDPVDRLAVSVFTNAIDGPALGGGAELALACDLRVAASDAVVGLPEILLGIIPAGGGTQRLVRTVGRATATDLILTGRKVSAGESLELGLVNRVSPPDSTAENEALLWAGTLAARPAMAVAAAKRALAAAGQPGGFDVEREAFMRLAESRDAAEGIAAFLERRAPSYEHR